MTDALVFISPLEFARFGVVTARCRDATATDFAQVVQFCRANDVALLIARCDAAHSRFVHVCEEVGGRLMDTLVYYSRNLMPPPVGPESAGAGVAVRPFRRDEALAVRDVAAASFEGYAGHYHNDPRLDRAKSDETYADWAHRSCMSREVADEVLVAEHAGSIVGFLTLRRNGPEEVEIPLNGVAPAFQGKGVYRRLLHEAIHWSQAKSALRLIVSTQLTNVRAQQCWVGGGFKPVRADYTFHVWFR